MKTLDSMTKAIKKWKVGPGSEEGVMVGPLQNELQYNKVKGLFEDAKKSGYAVAFGGEVKESNGFFLDPTVIDNPPEDSKLVVDEQFVCCCTRAND